MHKSKAKALAGIKALVAKIEKDKAKPKKKKKQLAIVGKKCVGFILGWWLKKISIGCFGQCSKI